MVGCFDGALKNRRTKTREKSMRLCGRVESGNSIAHMDDNLWGNALQWVDPQIAVMWFSWALVKTLSMELA